MEVLIIGLGNIGHAMLSSIEDENIIVDTVTSTGDYVKNITNSLGQSHEIRNNYTYENLEKKDYDFVILTLPYKQKIIRMNQIKGKISIKSTIVITPANQGTYYYMPDDLKDNNYILLERVPQISRIETKNVLVNVLGTRNDLRYSTKGDVDINKFIKVYPYLNKMVYLENKDDISLISSNATLHTARIYNLFKDGENYNKVINFYKDWTNKDSEIFIKMENEILNIAQKKAASEGIKSNVYDMYTHFKVDVVNESNMTNKITTNKALNSITFYAKNKDDLVKNRYFEDDVMIGLYFFIQLAKKYNVESKTLQLIYNWGLTLTDELEVVKKLNI